MMVVTCMMLSFIGEEAWCRWRRWRFLVEVVSCVAACPPRQTPGSACTLLIALAAGQLAAWLAASFSDFRWRYEGANHEGPATCIAPLCRRCGVNDVPRRRGIHISGRWQINRSQQQYLRTAPIGGGIDPQQQESK